MINYSNFFPSKIMIRFLAIKLKINSLQAKRHCVPSEKNSFLKNKIGFAVKKLGLIILISFPKNNDSLPCYIIKNKLEKFVSKK